MNLLVPAALVILTLTRVDGKAVYINAHEITAVAEPTIKTINPATRCIVFLTDRHFVAIIETCTKVYNMLQHEIRRAEPP